MGVLRDVVKGVKPVATDWTAHSLEAVAGDPSLGGTATEVSGRGGPGRYSEKSLAWEVRPAVPSFGCFESRRERDQICNHRLDIGCFESRRKRGKSVTTDWTAHSKWPRLDVSELS